MLNESVRIVHTLFSACLLHACSCSRIRWQQRQGANRSEEWVTVPMAEICSFIVIIAKNFDWQSIDIFYIFGIGKLRPILLCNFRP